MLISVFRIYSYSSESTRLPFSPSPPPLFLRFSPSFSPRYGFGVSFFSSERSLFSSFDIIAFINKYYEAGPCRQQQHWTPVRSSR
jgi:hypothetical protein